MKFIAFINLLVAMEATKKHCQVLTDESNFEIRRAKRTIRRSQDILALAS